MIPELVGRLPIFCPLSKLDENQLVRLLTEPKNALVKQYSKLLAMYGAKLDVHPDALKAMAAGSDGARHRSPGPARHLREPHAGHHVQGSQHEKRGFRNHYQENSH